MQAKNVVQQVGSDIEAFTLEDLKKAVDKLEKGDLYTEIIINAINSADEKDIGAAFFMWFCRYLEIEILGKDGEIEF